MHANFSKETRSFIRETKIKRSRIAILKIDDIISEIKNLLDGLDGRMDMREEKASGVGERAIKIM